MHQPPSKNGGLVKPLPFGKFGRRFNPPPPPRKGGTHYAMGLALKEFAWARDCLALALLIVNTGIHEIFY